ncbi:MAG: penicillin-binding transpeptidase domain-containing protein [Bacteroidota bacterium]|nr:penicillin-binding transpeptidase domain-containing protein [Bacteroidota bacterium]MDP4216286.1 penicillin-binding transpeptidase domain-containing protein [Bacteroidota bacterium]MDP4244451.1 penicillin-binding transpeptidase domain-containing protein [Bacteroidota bacterium]MDP4255203.1 penicillin-binding transpeptidase domain-containing protein [Bacteroidota bacterium]MDP4258180.1 penicillin-binding transpeptidase domain-containing protein [Bacteroidota bacterium]
MPRLALRFFLLSLVIPFFFAACSHNNVNEDNSLKKVFDSAGVNGCFALLDNDQGQFTIYNLRRYRDSAYLPASTFKIVNSLIGIQTGLVKDETTVIPWDHVTTGRTECEQDMTMRDAFQRSCVNWYQELARRIGKDTMKKWIDSLGYGNRDISGPIDSFWLNDRLKITADEELGLVKRLYFDQLPFFPRSQRIVRDMMLMENNANYKLSYKTGWGYTREGHSIGWIVGWIEENKHPYFFVLNLESLDRSMDLQPVRMRILRDILGQLGFFHGKK